MALKGIVVMKSKHESRPNGKLRLRIFVPVERVLGVSEFLLNLKDTLTGIYKRVSSECSICVTITSVITALRPKKALSGVKCVSRSSWYKSVSECSGAVNHNQPGKSQE